MRIVSWTVILGAAVALWFGGIRPLLPEGLLPEVDPAGVSGTVVRERGAEVCSERPEAPPADAGRSPEKPEPCREKLVTQH